MIKTRYGETELHGGCAEIMADYSSITKAIFEFFTEEIEMSEDEAKERLKYAYDRSFMTEDEREDFIGNGLKGVIVDILEDILEDLKDWEIEESEGK